MNEAELKVFGVLRFADEIELLVWEVAKRSGLSSRRAIAAVRGLRKAGLVETRREPYKQVFVRLRH